MDINVIQGPDRLLKLSAGSWCIGFPEVCDALSICEWKLELMATIIFRQVLSGGEKAIVLACDMLSKFSEINDEKRDKQILSLKNKQLQLEKRRTRYLDMYADGDLTKRNIHRQ